jgi:hypothetical protein
MPPGVRLVQRPGGILPYLPLDGMWAPPIAVRLHRIAVHIDWHEAAGDNARSAVARPEKAVRAVAGRHGRSA